MTPRPYLSIVVPAYNEESRLPASLQKVAEFLSRQAYKSDVIVVDDGSDDRTAVVAEAVAGTLGNVRVIRNPHRGKAYAVRTGVMAAHGELIFISDADLSMPIDEVSKFIKLIDQGYGLVIGSREAPGARRIGEPSHRHVMGRAFNLLVRLVAVGGFQDTQCGFKCFRREVAVDLFPRLRIRTSEEPLTGPMVTGFDVEVLYLALKRHYQVAEVGVDWYYAPGSKVNPIKDSLRMFSDVVKVRLNDIRGFYDRPVVDRAKAIGDP